MFTRIDNIWPIKNNKLEEIKIIYSMLSGYNRIKFEVNSNKIIRKLNYLKIKYRPLDIPWVKEEITGTLEIFIITKIQNNLSIKGNL